MLVAGSQGGQEAGQESGDFAEAGEGGQAGKGDGLPWPAAVLRALCGTSLRWLRALSALQPLRRLGWPCRAQGADLSALWPHRMLVTSKAAKESALQEAAELRCSVCSHQERNTWVPPSKLRRSAAAGHRIRAARGVPAMLWHSCTTGTARCLPGPGGCEVGLVLWLPMRGCGAQRVRGKALLVLINPPESLPYYKWQLNSDRHGKSLKVHQHLLAGDSKKLLFASEKQSEITLKQPFWG